MPPVGTISLFHFQSIHQNQKNRWYWWGIKYHLFMPLPSGLLTPFLMWYQRVFKSLSSAYFSCKNAILCRNDILNVNIINSHVCIGGVDETNVLIPSYVSLWITVFFFISDGSEDICFSHFSCEKQISSHPSEAVQVFSDGATTSINNFSYVFFTLSIIITYTLSLSRCERARSFVPALLSGDHGASPPLSEIRLKQDEYWGGHGKKDIGE